jgi:hypothetical protein
MMMKKGIINIAIVYLLVIVVFASTGFQVFSSFCHCTKTESFTVFAPKNCCNENSSNSCETPKLKAKCCSQTSIFIKFTEQYIPTFSSSPVKTIWTAMLFNYSSVVLKDITENNSFCSLTEKPPFTYLYGKTMVYRFHAIKIPCA